MSISNFVLKFKEGTSATINGVTRDFFDKSVREGGTEHISYKDWRSKNNTNDLDEYNHGALLGSELVYLSDSGDRRMTFKLIKDEDLNHEGYTREDIGEVLTVMDDIDGRKVHPGLYNSFVNYSASFVPNLYRQVGDDPSLSTNLIAEDLRTALNHIEDLLKGILEDNSRQDELVTYIESLTAEGKVFACLDKGSIVGGMLFIAGTNTYQISTHDQSTFKENSHE